MLFNSFDFLIFFLIVFGLYYAFKNNLKVQNILLLVSSYLFYGWWDARFLFLIVLSTLTDYCAGIMISTGKLSLKQRLISSGYLIVSAFLFIIISWKNIGIDIISFKIDLSSAISWGENEKKILTGSLILVAIANLVYPVFEKFNMKNRQKIFLLLSILVNLSLLGFFKYYNFFIESFVDFSKSVFGYSPNIWSLNIILPVGISFYTFQTMSYTIDVFRKELDASTDFIEFATYVAFFPQLVAGPIERGKHLLPQFRKARTIAKNGDFRDSLWLIVWGLFKKMVVADNMASIVNNIFGPYDGGLTTIPHNALVTIIGILAFAFQIYGDFSGYTDIARGTAKLMGFDIMLNFNLPYFAISPSDFWRRWHISLSTWLRDYLYIPLGGNRKGTFSTYKNLFLTMLLGGLWHGAAWTFVIWGAYHGFILILYRLANIDKMIKTYSKLSKLGMIIFMFVLTCIGWLIFRAQNISTISLFLKSIFVSSYDLVTAIEPLKNFAFYGWFLILFQFIQYFSGNLFPQNSMHKLLRLHIWLFVIFSILFLSAQEAHEFIYFAF